MSDPDKTTDNSTQADSGDLPVSGADSGAPDKVSDVADAPNDAAELQGPVETSEPPGEPDPDPGPADMPASKEVDSTDQSDPGPAAVAPGSASGGKIAAWAALGGALAAVAGFAFAWFIAQDGWPLDMQDRRLAGLEIRQAETQAEQDTTTREIAALTATLEEVRETANRAVDAIPALTREMAGVTARLNSLEQRLASIEARPVVETTPDVGEDIAKALSGYRDQVAALSDQVARQARRADAIDQAFSDLTQEFDTRISGAEALANEARDVERAVLAQGALAALGRAIATGAPFDEQLADLAATAAVAAPPDLTAVAAKGAPTLSALRGSFPAAARAALAASTRVDEAGGAMDRLGAFLKKQTGARSLTPKDGDDADAVLSRAEQALREGRVADTIDLLDNLPQAARVAVAGWIEPARIHASTHAAYEALSQALSPN